MKRTKAIVTLVLACLLWGAHELGILELEETGSSRSPATESSPATGSTSTTEASAAEIADAFRTRRSGFMITLDGQVSATLPDDREGSQHQRFIVRLSDGQTLLVAHNIDLAPRVPLDKNDAVRIKGQYEWNEKGGVLHWTHHDPDKRHEEGWIEHQGKRYE